MSTSPSLEDALRRLAAALTRLEDAAERRVEVERSDASREIEVQALSDDRARLAQELDDSFAKAARIEAANRDVSRRLDQAIDTIRSVLEPQGN